MLVYGINFSEQVDDKKGQLIVKASVQSAGLGVVGGVGAGASVVLAPFTFGLSLIPGAMIAGSSVAEIIETAEIHHTLNNNTIIPLCQSCQSYLSNLKAQPWEKTKLKCKNEAKYCYHSLDTPEYTFFDKDEKSHCLIEKSSNGGRYVPTLEMITTGECREHSNCYFQKNSWGDEEHSIDKGKDDKGDKSNNDNIIKKLEQIEKYMEENSIEEIKLKDGKLEVKYSSNETKLIMADTPELKVVESYCQSKVNKSFSKQELKAERERERERAKVLSIELRGLLVVA